MIIRQFIVHRILIACLFCASGSVVAQSDSLEVHQIKGKPYYIHVVKKGESLYAIHKKYDVPIDIIKKENPGVLDGLSIDEKVFIPLKRNEGEDKKVDGNYIEHTVQKKQTLYAIAKLYKVQQNEIIAANPELNDGLKEGQVIKIPIKKLKQEAVEIEIPQPNKKHRTHVVQQGETLYALSKKYDVSIEAIQAVNGGLSQGLREGETIYLPLSAEEMSAADTAITVLDSVSHLDTFARKPFYHIGLLLPFYLDENDEMVDNRTALEEKTIYPRSKFAIEFYKGFTQMLDSIASDSANFKLFVYDTKGSDTARIKSLLKRPEMQGFDLIIGPLYHDNFELVANFAHEHNIPIATPVKQSNKILLGKPSIFKVIPSKTAIVEPIAKLVVDSFKTDNLLIVAHDESKEKALGDMLSAAYNRHLMTMNDTSAYASFQKVEVSSSLEQLVAKLKTVGNNVLFVPSSDQSFVTTLFSQLIGVLNNRNYKECTITLIGLEEWSKFRNIDIDYYQRLNVHYWSSQFINERDSMTQLCIQNYIKATETYPTKNAMLGCDLAEYFGSKLIAHGTVMKEDDAPFEGKSISLSFFKTGIESGHENQSGTLLRYFDYAIEPIPQLP